MPYTPEELLKITANYERLTSESLVASAKKKEKKNSDPKAKSNKSDAKSSKPAAKGKGKPPFWLKKKDKKSAFEAIDEMLTVYGQAAQDPWAVQTHPSTGVTPQTRSVAPVSEDTSVPTETAEDRYKRLQQTYQAQQPVAKSAPKPATVKPAPDHWVAALQNFLVAKNLLAPTSGGKYQVDGVMGGNTAAALKTWQQQMSELDGSIKPTGQLDQATINMLNPLIQTYKVDNIVGA